MYVFGGCDGNSCFGDLHEYDFRTRQWALVDVPHCPAPRYFQLMCTDGDCMYILGGKDLWGRCFDEVHEFRVRGAASAKRVDSLLGSGSAAGEGAKLRLKLHFDQEIRLLVVDKSITFEALLSKLHEQYQGTVSLRYKDEDEDLVTVRCQEDWINALEFHQRSALPNFKVFLDRDRKGARSEGGKRLSQRDVRVDDASAPRSASPGLQSLSPRPWDAIAGFQPPPGSSPKGLPVPAATAAAVAKKGKPFSSIVWQTGEMIGQGAFGQGC
jgi:hypothetical protein